MNFLSLVKLLEIDHHTVIIKTVISLSNSEYKINNSHFAFWIL